jgi:hypothetical protein
MARKTRMPVKKRETAPLPNHFCTPGPFGWA